MKRLFYTCFAVLLLWLPLTLQGQNVVQLTPKPYRLTKGTRQLTLPAHFAINISTLPDSNKVEVERFAKHWEATTGGTVTLTTHGESLFTVSKDEEQAHAEGYELSVTPTGIALSAGSNKGFFYAFKTLLQLLPAEVRAGVKMEGFVSTALPAVTIKDYPRFEYRGFMLDVARHFFSTDEIKKLLDLMADYKMNRFHWHLTDDQGWRIEIKKYPKLTTVGATAPNCYVTDMQYGPYWTNAAYGPYFYTQEEIKEIVAYAKERHIEIIPEIDMPGHFTAAMAAYPEYSCWPNGKHEVKTTGGIFTDILNVGNPAAVQFAKDILAEVMELFPYSQIHIGGDECPTTAWEGNADCQQVYREAGLTHYRQLQSRFIKEMADFIATKGKQTVVWNEAITAEHADLDLIKNANVTVFCWQPAVSSARKAAELGLDNVITPWGPYYINRKQSTRPDEPSAAGDGSDNLAKTYNFQPVPTDLTAAQKKRYKGVQGTFWTEHVADTAYLEYLALPRLFAVAEAGWTLQGLRSYNDFVQRLAADTAVWKLKNFNFCLHDLRPASVAEKVFPKTSTTGKRYYYKLVTQATGERKDRCIELLQEGSPLIATHEGKGATVNRLWTAPQAAIGATNEDAQLWALEESPTTPHRYALVCKAQEGGSVSPMPTATTTAGRWTYDVNQKHYVFVLGEKGYGKSVNGAYTYSIRPASLTNGFLNASMSGQGMAVNVYNNPTSGNAGVWAFVPASDVHQEEALMKEAQELVMYAQTYEGEKQEGKFGRLQKERLAAALSTPSEEMPQSEYVALVREAVDAMYASFGTLTNEKEYLIANAVAGYDSTLFSDPKTDGYLRHLVSNQPTDAETWVIEGAQPATQLTQRVYIKNKQTKRYLYAAASKGDGTVGNPARMSIAKGWVEVKFNLRTSDYSISLSGNQLYPVPTTSVTLPSIVSTGLWLNNQLHPAIRPQGNAWIFKPASTVNGISLLENRPTTTPLKIYDLSGREVAHPKKGLYIIGNQKVFVP